MSAGRYIEEQINSIQGMDSLCPSGIRTGDKLKITRKAVYISKTFKDQMRDAKDHEGYVSDWHKVYRVTLFETSVAYDAGIILSRRYDVTVEFEIIKGNDEY